MTEFPALAVLFSTCPTNVGSSCRSSKPEGEEVSSVVVGRGENKKNYKLRNSLQNQIRIILFHDESFLVHKN